MNHLQRLTSSTLLLNGKATARRDVDFDITTKGSEVEWQKPVKGAV